MTDLDKYVTVDEFRYETNVQSGEWEDHKIEQFLKAATVDIDNRTGRTWKGVQTVTDEYHDGDGKTFLYLDHKDIQSITALGVDDDFTGNFTTVTTAYTRYYSDIGRLELNVETSDAATIEVSSFAKGHKNVKVSYTYGNSTPTADVRDLCIRMVQYRLNPTPELMEEINKKIQELRVDDLESV